MYEATYFALCSRAGTISKTLHICYNTVKLATVRPISGSPRFSGVKPARVSLFRYSHDEPVQPGHINLPEFGVLPLCSFRCWTTAARRPCPPSLSANASGRSESGFTKFRFQDMTQYPKKNLTNGMPDKTWRQSYLACHWSDFSGYSVISWNLNLLKPDSGLCPRCPYTKGWLIAPCCIFNITASGNTLKLWLFVIKVYR